MPEPSPKVPLSFLIATFGGATVVAILIIYFGMRGQIGGPIP
jgi:hypothetical protein